MAGLLKTPSLHLTPTLFHAPSVPFKPFCVSFAGGRNAGGSIASLSHKASLRFTSSGHHIRLLNFIRFASGEAETTETDVESETQDTDDSVDVEGENAAEEVSEVEEEEASVTIGLLSSYKEALAENNESKVAEIEASLKSIEDEKTQLESKIASLSNELSVERDRLIRISADFDNFRKRTERDRLNLVTNAQGEVVENLLAVLDNFERAKAQIKIETEGEEKVTNSYQNIYKQFVEILNSLGVVPVETIGKEFDPMLHEAIMREESTEYEEGIVLEEYRKGFLLGDRLLRPSMVKVSAGPGPVKTEEKPQEEEEDVAEESKEEEEAASSS